MSTKQKWGALEYLVFAGTLVVGGLLLYGGYFAYLYAKHYIF